MLQVRDKVSCEFYKAIYEEKFCTGDCENRASEREAEESPLLEAVVREWLVNTEQAGKGCSY
jgi:hypothetical protein